MPFTYTNQPTHPQSPNFGDGFNSGDAASIGQAWKDKGWSTHALVKPTSTSPQDWDEFVKNASSN